MNTFNNDEQYFDSQLIITNLLLPNINYDDNNLKIVDGVYIQGSINSGLIQKSLIR